MMHCHHYYNVLHACVSFHAFTCRSATDTPHTCSTAHVTSRRYLMCDSYQGCDQEFEFDINVKPALADDDDSDEDESDEEEAGDAMQE